MKPKKIDIEIAAAEMCRRIHYDGAACPCQMCREAMQRLSKKRVKVDSLQGDAP